MFTCSKCSALADEIKFLREQNRALMDRLVALANSQAYQAVSYDRGNSEEFYGGGQDQYVAYDQYGGQILVEKNVEPKE